MQVNKITFFAPGIELISLDFGNKNQIIESFEKRIFCYYLEPAKILNEKEMGFAAGVILMTTIDAITYYSMNKNNIIEFFKLMNSEFSEDDFNKIANKFYEYFRNGLIHEGRIKGCGQFTYESNQLLFFENNILVINPSVLLDKVVEYFNNYIEKLKKDNDHYSIFIKKLEKLFSPEIHKLKQLS
ncbi:MAG: hypothetical protein ABI855_08630 [Bacteroidota bacterium]